MTSRLDALCLDATAPGHLARFWAELLGREQREDARGALVPGDALQVSLRFVPNWTAKRGPNRVHLHLTSSDQDDQQRQVATALRLGARHLDVGQRREEGHVVLADPEGNELCVIEAGNGFLAGCGLLGEVACEGTRSVGLFWGEALGWPLVWDQDQETAVQSPAGGTKVAWGGPPLPPLTSGPRQRFLLESVDRDHQAEVDRLTFLGATRLGLATPGDVRPSDVGLSDVGPAAVRLADPDGNEFVLLPRS